MHSLRGQPQSVLLLMSVERALQCSADSCHATAVYTLCVQEDTVGYFVRLQLHQAQICVFACIAVGDSAGGNLVTVMLAALRDAAAATTTASTPPSLQPYFVPAGSAADMV